MSERPAPAAAPGDAAAALTALADGFLRAVRPAPAEVPGPLRAPAAPAVLVVDPAGRVQACDAEAERLSGRRAAEVVGAPLAELLDVAAEATGRGWLRRADGSRVPVVVSRHAVQPPAASGAVYIVRPEEAAAERPAELRYRNLVEQIPAVVFTASLEGGLSDIYVGPQIESLLGYTQAEWIGNPVLWYERLHPDDHEVLNREFARGCASGGPFRAECRFLARDGRIVWVHGEARLIRASSGWPLLLQGVAFDITETKRAEEVVRAALREKELLLKEIHHRVKNNLQVTSSLLRLQLPTLHDPQARLALRESQDRIRSMALVHEMLYQSPDLSRIDFGRYVRTLVQQLFRSHDASPQRIRADVQVDDVALGIDLAVPCGLLINELVSNALRHAFPDGRRGTVRVRLTAAPDGYRLAVADDGVGLPSDFAQRRGRSLGIQLVELIGGQIGGRLEVHAAGGGAEFVVVFPRTREP